MWACSEGISWGRTGAERGNLPADTKKIRPIEETVECQTSIRGFLDTQTYRASNTQSREMSLSTRRGLASPETSVMSERFEQET